jgi:tetratricopeptide (TPR) repeat protein
MGIQDYEKALSFFNKALTQKANSVDFLVNRSQCYFYLNQKEKSITDLESATQFETKGDNPKVLYKLGLAYYSTDNFKRAIRTLKRAIKSHPNVSYLPDIYYHIALGYCNLN